MVVVVMMLEASNSLFYFSTDPLADVSQSKPLITWLSLPTFTRK
jgi:hypothetical protein